MSQIGMADFNKPAEPCSCCGANNSDAPWTACVDGSSVWQSRIWNNATYAAAKPGRHRLFRHVPGLGISMYIPDEMHSKHLGIDKSFAASVLKNLTHHVLTGTDQENLTTVVRNIKLEYKKRRTQTRFNTITRTMIHGKAKLPQLKGKAAQIRSLIPILATIWRSNMDDQETY